MRIAIEVFPENRTLTVGPVVTPLDQLEAQWADEKAREEEEAFVALYRQGSVD